MSTSTFRVLSIDGGGIRGVFPAHILNCVSQRLDIDVGEQFDMIAGTSTGSIIAAAIACKIDPKKIVQLYQELGPKIFAKKKSLWPAKLKPVVHSLYDGAHLDSALKDVFGDTRLGDISVPLLLPATDIGHGGVHVFKSSYSKDFTRDKDVLLRQAILASCSAPTYFDPVPVGAYLLADGGLWANNPSLAAFVDAQYRLSVEPAAIRMFSIGTGSSRTAYGVNTQRKWGLIRGWRGKELIGFLMSIQAQSIHNYLQLVMGEGQLLRLDFESDNPLPLDNCSIMADLISRADRVFTHQSADIRKFLNDN